MLSIKLRLGILAGAVLAAISVLPASAAVASPGHASHAMAVPLTATECNPNPIQSANECTTVVGTGLYVDHISGTLFSNSLEDLTKIHIQIYGPHGTLHNCAQFTLPALGVSDPCLWLNPTPSVHVTAGNYCSRAWQKIGSAFYVVSTECVDVHS